MSTPWNHVEAAMALLVADRHDAVEPGMDLGAQHPAPRRLLAHCRRSAGAVEDPSVETNMAAYVAVGVWHHWLVRP